MIEPNAVLDPPSRSTEPTDDGLLEGRRLLFVQPGAGRDGSAISGGLLVRGLLEAGADVRVVFGQEGPAVGDYERLGCATSVIPFGSWLRRRGWLRFAKRYWEESARSRAFDDLVRSHRPEIVYVNSLVGLPGAVAARRAGLPCMWHVREQFQDVGGEMICPAWGGRSFVRRVLARHATRLVAISRSVAENVLGPSLSKRTEIVPNAVPDSFFDRDDTRPECRRRLGLPVGGRLVGVPGHLRPVKGHAFFLEAVARLHGRGELDDLTFAITGNGSPSYVEQLHRMASSLGLADRVRFTGPVSDMWSFYRACDIVCVPSVAEGFGRTMAESFAVGTPVVASAVGGMIETIEDGITGVLVPYGDVAALASALGELLEAPSRRNRMAEAACEVARRDFREEACRSRIRTIVAGLTGVVDRECTMAHETQNAG